MKNEFIRFLFKCLFYAVLIGVGYGIIYRAGITPTVTNSALFDKKMFLIQKQGLKDVKVMGFGASIPLYALNSEMMVRHLGASYYNFGSWSLQIADMRYLLRSFVDEYHPRYVILCSNIGDYRRKGDSTYLKFGETSRLIREWLPELFYLKHYSSVYEMNHRRHSERYMDLDPWGGMPLTVPAKDISQADWNSHWQLPTEYTSYEYRQLDSLADFLRDRGIKLIFVQAPLKAGYANTPETTRWLAAHFDSCRRIVEGDGGVYLNYYNTRIFTDSLFFDQYHLQAAGGKIMTGELLNDIKTIIK